MTGRDNLGEIGIDGRIILKRIRKKFGLIMFTTLTYMAQDRHQKLSLANTVP